MSKKNSTLAVCSISFAITLAMMVALYYLRGYAPFGELSLAYGDANYQYLDLFSFLKDVLSGKNDIFYSFSKTLGGTYIAVFSYYLSSPFNLLILFFDKCDLVVFIDIIIVLKLGTAAATAAFFLKERFQGKLSNLFVILLSLSYAFMQYSIAQSSNIMWLDGVYMLPLMLLGINRVVDHKSPILLIISTALSIVFNWYTAGINCLFAAVWFILEMLLTIPEKVDDFKRLVKNVLKTSGMAVIYMILGVALSAFLFLPTMESLVGGGRGILDWSIFENTFTANITNIIQNFVLGSKSSDGSVSLYCGSLALLGCMCFFTSKNIHLDKKIKTGAVLAFCLMIFYWQPLFRIFSLFKEATSYWYRYSYVTIFLLIFIAGEYFSEVSINREENSLSLMMRNGVLFSAAILLISYVTPAGNLRQVYYTCAVVLVIAFLAGMGISQYESQSIGHRRVVEVLLALALIAELSYNTRLLMNLYHLENASKYHDYSVAEQEQINELQSYDPEFYRITQTLNYNMSRIGQTTANYNESAAYNYRSLSGYTSDPDDMQREFLDRLGYRINGENMCIVNTSILGADSLLGVKYVLSPDSINGLEKIDSLGTYNDKNVYLNPYALPMAFVYPETGDSVVSRDSDNPFEYQNMLYSELLGEETVLYSPLDFEVTDDEKGVRTYTINIPDGSQAVYGNIPWGSYMNSTLDVNGSYKQSYSRWCSPSVFYIPTSEGDSTASIVMNYEKNDIADEQFYALNLDALSEVSEKINAKAADSIFIENGHARFETYANEDENLYTSIPYHRGWTVTLNGREVTPQLFGYCLMSIPLEAGDNVIEMDFSVPGFNAGIVISIAAAGILIAMCYIDRRNRKKQNIV